MGEKIGRFKSQPKIGVLVAIRSAESFDRYSVLKQGLYNTGRYGTQYDCAVYSPFMDLRTEDLWRTISLLDMDANEIYSMMYDSGVPLAKQRIGSPVNSHSGDAVKLYKVLNPGTYSKMLGRLNNLDFTSAYGGVFNNGFKYIQLTQPKPFYDGPINSEVLVNALNYLELDYSLRLINQSVDDDDTKRVYNTKDRPVKLSENIRLRVILPDFARRLAAEKARENGDNELAEKFESAVPKEKTWYDYCVQLVNEAEPMYQKSWMPKFKTSIKHWARTGSAVNEATIIGLRCLSNRKNKDYGFDKYDYEEWVDWAIAGYTDITRLPIVKFFRYNQDCAENLMRKYIEDILENWDNGGRDEFEQNHYLVDIMLNGGIIPACGPIVWYKSAPSAKEVHQCVFQKCKIGGGDKMTGSSELSDDYLDKDEYGIYWAMNPDMDIDDIIDIDENSLKIGSGPLGTGGNGVNQRRYSARMNLGWRYKGKNMRNGGIDNGTGVNGANEVIEKVAYRLGDGRFVSEERVKEMLAELGKRFWHDEVKQSASWKRATITCLRSDLKGTYMGFGQNTEEKLIRANALAAFADNEEERQKKIKEAQQLTKKIASDKKKELEEANVV